MSGMRLIGLVIAMALVSRDARAVRHATEAEFARVLDQGQEPAGHAEHVGAPEEVVEAFERLDGDAVLTLTVELLDLRDVKQARDLWVGLFLDGPPGFDDLPDSWLRWEGSRLTARRNELLASVCSSAPEDARALDLLETSLFDERTFGLDIPPLADALASPHRRLLWRGLDWTLRGHQLAGLRLLGRAASDPLLAPRAHFAMGRTLVRLNRPDEALVELEAAGDAPEWYGRDLGDETMSSVGAWRSLALDCVRSRQATHPAPVLEDPFGYFWTRKSAFANDATGVRALAALSRRDLAMTDLARLEQSCNTLDWEPVCVMLPDVRAELGPELERGSVPCWIAAPLMTAFEVRRVPSRWRTPWSADQDHERERLVVPAALVGDYIVHVATDGTRVLAVSSGVRGGVGGEWLHLSRDGGAHFDAPLFLGEAMNFPHALLARVTSNVPPFDGDVVQVEVERLQRSLWDSFSPDEGTARQRDLFVRISVEALRRDSDGDGLTDLVEESLLLDPRNRDTDGDGLLDSADPSPRVAVPATSSLGGRLLLATFLGERIDISGPQRREEMLRVPDGPQELAASATSRKLPGIPFVVGDHANQVSPPPGVLWIGLTNDEWAAATAKMGPRLHASVRLLFDQNGSCLLHVGDANGGSETLRGHLEGSDWILTSRGVLIADYFRLPAPPPPPRRLPR